MFIRGVIREAGLALWELPQNALGLATFANAEWQNWTSSVQVLAFERPQRGERRCWYRLEACRGEVVEGHRVWSTRAAYRFPQDTFSDAR